MSDGKTKVAVLAGGVGSERQISIESGRCVAAALRISGYEVVTADIAPDNLEILDDRSLDVFFICLHGQFGEDGQVQRILEQRGLCYTHSDSTASKAAMDKMTAKRRFAAAGVNTPPAIVFREEMTKEQIEKQLGHSANKFVVKPLSNGSSVGVEIVDGAEAARAAARRCWEELGDCMIEQFVAGREITVGILNGRVLPILEIRPRVGFYDYHAKYLADNTEYLFGTITDSGLVNRISGDALKCFDYLGCRGVARVDFILGSDGVAYALEINTVPGMTEHSCVPKAAARIGISMGELCSSIVKQTVADYRQRNSRIMEVSADGAKTKEKQILGQGI